MDTIIIMDACNARVVIKQVPEGNEEAAMKIAQEEDMSWGDCEWMSGVQSIEFRF